MEIKTTKEIRDEYNQLLFSQKWVAVDDLIKLFEEIREYAIKTKNKELFDIVKWEILGLDLNNYSPQTQQSCPDKSGE